MRCINLRPNPAGDRPKVDSTAYVDPTASIVGRVEVGPRVFVGPNAVLRADEVGPDGRVAPIVLEAECNVQDGVIVHALAGTGVTAGRRASLAHGCIAHGPCALGEGCFVGFGAVVFRARVGAGAFIGARAVVQGVDLPDEAYVPPLCVLSAEGIAALRKTTPEERQFIKGVVLANLRLVVGYSVLASSGDSTGQSEAASTTNRAR
jgi:carbonic anhydrase/acetyltransferase-like protein (isoleucine patch superfamily)